MPLSPSETLDQPPSGLDLTAWIGLMAPAGTPLDIVRTLNREIDAILASDETAAWAQRRGLEIARGSAESFARTVADDYARWGAAIRGMSPKGRPEGEYRSAQREGRPGSVQRQ